MSTPSAGTTLESIHVDSAHINLNCTPDSPSFWATLHTPPTNAGCHRCPTCVEAVARQNASTGSCGASRNMEVCEKTNASEYNPCLAAASSNKHAGWSPAGIDDVRHRPLRKSLKRKLLQPVAAAWQATGGCLLQHAGHVERLIAGPTRSVSSDCRMRNWCRSPKRRQAGWWG